VRCTGTADIFNLSAETQTQRTRLSAFDLESCQRRGRRPTTGGYSNVKIRGTGVKKKKIPDLLTTLVLKKMLLLIKIFCLVTV